MSDNSPDPANSSDPANPSDPAGAEPVAWLRVATPYAGYADAVVADISRIVATPSGRAVLEQVRASGRSVLIERPSVRDPPNAWVQPLDGGDCTITYEPAQWPNPLHPESETSDVMLFRLLRQALAPLQGKGTPTGDPAAEPGGGEAADISAAVVRYLRERDGE
jgi:hypothetical protein